MLSTKSLMTDFYLSTVPVDHTFFLANFCTASLAAAASSTSGYSTQQSRSSSAYDAKKLNGSGLQQQQQQQLTNGSDATSDSHLRVVTPAKNGARTSSDYVGASSVMQQAASPRTGGMQNMYDQDKSDLSNGMYSHELVSAISQIAQHRREDNVGSSGGVVKSSHRVNLVDRWGRQVDETGPMRLSTSATGSAVAVGVVSASSVVGNKDLSMLANDASSDDLSTTSDDVGVNDVALSKSESREPLSFARIASLNLEKQQQVKIAWPLKVDPCASPVTLYISITLIKSAY